MHRCGGNSRQHQCTYFVDNASSGVANKKLHMRLLPVQRLPFGGLWMRKNERSVSLRILCDLWRRRLVPVPIDRPLIRATQNHVLFAFKQLMYLRNKHFRGAQFAEKNQNSEGR